MNIKLGKGMTLFMFIMTLVMLYILISALMGRNSYNDIKNVIGKISQQISQIGKKNPDSGSGGLYIDDNQNKAVPEIKPTSGGRGGGGGGEKEGGGGASTQEPITPKKEELPPLPSKSCTEESRLMESCPDSADVVCGWFIDQDSCISKPCVRMFPSECHACMDLTIQYITDGECPLH